MERDSNDVLSVGDGRPKVAYSPGTPSRNGQICPEGVLGDGPSGGPNSIDLECLTTKPEQRMQVIARKDGSGTGGDRQRMDLGLGAGQDRAGAAQAAARPRRRCSRHRLTGVGVGAHAPGHPDQGPDRTCAEKETIR